MFFAVTVSYLAASLPQGASGRMCTVPPGMVKVLPPDSIWFWMREELPMRSAKQLAAELELFEDDVFNMMCQPWHDYSYAARVLMADASYGLLEGLSGEQAILGIVWRAARKILANEESRACGGKRCESETRPRQLSGVIDICRS